MPRVTHVQAAQQRYERVPVIDEATGQPRVVPVNRTARSGHPVTMTVTRDDRDKPLPPYTCDYCHQPIAIGTPYKHITPKSGPYGGTRRNRHESCPAWQPWDYSSSLSARLSQVEHEFRAATESAGSPDDVTSALSDAAEAVREIAQEKRDSASSIEEGFQHPTSQSEELNEQAGALDEWADEIENVSVPDLPDPEGTECDDCIAGEEDDCGTCEGSGQVTPDEPTDDQMDEWRSEVESETALVGEPPV